MAGLQPVPIIVTAGLVGSLLFAAGPDGRLITLPGGALLSGLMAAAVPWLVWRRDRSALTTVVLTALVALIAWRTIQWTGADLAGVAGLGFWSFVVGLWALAWRAVDGLAALETPEQGWGRLVALAAPCGFGLWLVYGWEVIVGGFGVPQVLLPAPSQILATFASSTDILWADFQQTFIKSVLTGYAMGCGAGFIVAVLVDRSPFLQRGLLPLGNLVSALPIIGIAPIMVMWFGFDWQSKAAVVVVMTFFPMLVNSLAGLAAAGALERELMQTYGASYWQTLLKTRLPLALPFIFNALKINSTLALIGAIVAEFFGTPIVGMGFRISTEVGRMNVDMVWAEILMAAMAGSAFYGALALLERSVTFWHPSFRHRS